MKFTVYVPVVVEIDETYYSQKQVAKIEKDIIRDITSNYGGACYGGGYSYRAAQFTQSFLRSTINHKFKKGTK